MPKLNDTQTILLSTASQRESGSVFPLPVSTGARATKALAALTTSGFVEERQTADADASARTYGDLRYGLFITAGGLQAIGVEPLDAAARDDEADTPAPAPQRATKTAAVLELLGRAEGATLAELIAATGWLSHTTRAALTGLGKKGHSITRGKRDGATCYSVAAA